MQGRPHKDNYDPYFETYVSKVQGDDFMIYLKDDESYKLYKGLDNEQWDIRYAEGKWSLKEVLMHIMDTERIFAYRALRISRNDQLPLQGFDQDVYVPYYNVDERSGESLVAEYLAVRAATIAMFSNFNHDQFSRIGVASGKAVSVLALAYMIVGHEQHHLDITRNRYLGL